MRGSHIAGLSGEWFTFAVKRPFSRPQQGTPVSSSIYLVANDFPGGDLGAKIQAANDYAEGIAPGTRAAIYVKAGGTIADNTIATQVIFAANKTLYLGQGYYTNNVPENLAVAGSGVTFLIRDNFSIYGGGWNTIIEQPRSMVLVAPYTESTVSGDLAGVNTWNSGNFQVVTPNNPRTSSGGESVLAIGNSTNVTVDNIYFNRTYGIDITLGGNANPVGSPPVTNHCTVARVSNCVHYLNPADDAIKMAVVNAKNWSVNDCLYLNGAVFDIEQNTSGDDIDGWSVSGCIWDGAGLLVQGEQVRNGNVVANTFLGRGKGTTGVAVLRAINTRVADNVIDGYTGNDNTASTGISLIHALGTTIKGNTITNCSLPTTTPNPANAAPIDMQGAIGTVITDNRIESVNHGWSGIHEDANCVGTVLKDNIFGLGSGSTITVNAAATQDSIYGRISAASAGAVLPQATIYSPIARLCSSPGSFTIVTQDQGTQTVSYTGTTSTSFTGCTGGIGTLFLGPMADIALSGSGGHAWNNSIAVGDGTTVENWTKDPKIEGAVFKKRRTVSGTGQTLAITDSIVGVDTSTVACDLTLPDPATAIGTSATASWNVTVKDETGSAATHNITIKRHGTEKIDGTAADYVLNTNKGHVTLYSNGTDWLLL